MLVEADEVFNAVRRGYNELELADSQQIIDYFSGVNDAAEIGHVSNIKGILFEQLFVESLAQKGIAASVFDDTNHPLVDISVDTSSDIALEMQLKATDSASYVLASMSENPEVPFVVTSEVAGDIMSTHVIDSGISDVAIEDAVTETLFSEHFNPFSAFSILRWLVGIPF